MTTTWSYGGTTLATYGKVTKIDEYINVPERRGENILIPFRHGKTFAQKFYDERVIVFAIVINAASAIALESTVDSLKAKLSPVTLQTLSHTMADGTIRTIPAIVDNVFEVERIANWLAKYVITFSCPSPIFRLSTAIADNTTTINTSPKAMTVTNPGTIEEREPTILLTGPLTNPVITNSTNGAILTYTGVISAGHTVTIGTSNGEPYATHSVSGDVIGNVSHSGASALMVFGAGNNTLSITSDVATTGTVKASFYAPYL
jgi:hypothetical protein